MILICIIVGSYLLYPVLCAIMNRWIMDHEFTEEQASDAFESSIRIWLVAPFSCLVLLLLIVCCSFFKFLEWLASFEIVSRYCWKIITFSTNIITSVKNFMGFGVTK